MQSESINASFMGRGRGDDTSAGARVKGPFKAEVRSCNASFVWSGKADDASGGASVEGPRRVQVGSVDTSLIGDRGKDIASARASILEIYSTEVILSVKSAMDCVR
jgi:hypothetical protein